MGAVVGGAGSCVVFGQAMWGGIVRGMAAANWVGAVSALGAGVPVFRPTGFSDLVFTAAAFGTPYMGRATQRWMARDMATVA